MQDSKPSYQQPGYPTEMIQPQQSSTEDSVDIKRLFFRILGSWPIISISMVIGLVIALFIYRYATRIYEVNATVMVDSDQKGSMESLMSAVGYYNPRLEFENEVVILKSRTLTERTLQSLSFEISYYSEGKIKSSEIYPNPGWRLE